MRGEGTRAGRKSETETLVRTGKKSSRLQKTTNFHLSSLSHQNISNKKNKQAETLFKAQKLGGWGWGAGGQKLRNVKEKKKPEPRKQDSRRLSELQQRGENRAGVASGPAFKYRASACKWAELFAFAGGIRA